MQPEGPLHGTITILKFSALCEGSAAIEDSGHWSLLLVLPGNLSPLATNLCFLVSLLNGVARDLTVAVIFRGLPF